jgi:CRP-like cAMP-binding protein
MGVIMNDVQEMVSTCATLLSADINAEECSILSTMFRLHKLDTDDVLLSEGEKDDALHIVIEGDVVATRDAGGDHPVTLHHLKPGDIAGAMGFIDGSSHSATLRATRVTHVLTLHRDVLEQIVDKHPQLVYKIMKMIIRSVHRTLLRMNQQFVEMNNYIMKEHGRY